MKAGCDRDDFSVDGSTAFYVQRCISDHPDIILIAQLRDIVIGSLKCFSRDIVAMSVPVTEATKAKIMIELKVLKLYTGSLLRITR